MMLLSESRFDEQIAVAYHHLPGSLQNEFLREFGHDILNSAQQLLMDLEDYEVLNWAADWIEENSSMIWYDGGLWHNAPRNLEQIGFDEAFFLEEDGTAVDVLDPLYYEAVWRNGRVVVYGAWYVYAELSTSQGWPQLESPGTYVRTTVTDPEEPKADRGWAILKAVD